MGNTESKQMIECEWSKRRKTGSLTQDTKPHTDIYFLILHEIPLHGEISMQNNIIVFWKNDRRATNHHYWGGGQTLYLGKPTMSIFAHKNSMGFATLIQEYTRAKHCLLVLQVSSIWIRVAFSVSDKTACHRIVEYSWNVLRIKVGWKACARANIAQVKHSSTE